jgi:hypothetical protein
MATDQRPDWIDEVLTHDATWEPPRHFSQRVVLAAAVAGALPIERAASLPYLSFAGLIRDSFVHAAEPLLLRLENMRWVVRQYRALLWG